MPTFIKTGFWEKRKNPPQGYKGELNLDQFVASNSSASKYKVYTALLTQSGGSVPSAISSGNVTKGVTYMILGDNGDFSNVGAPNNNSGTYFVAVNNDVPITYGDASTELEYNTGAPVVTVLENTIGDIWFTYDSTGIYVINSLNLFTSPYTIFISNNTEDQNDSTQIVKTKTYDGDTSYITTFAYGVPSSGILYNTPIEIRVYN